MFNTRDEILKKFAGAIDDIDDLLKSIPAPTPPRLDKPEEGEDVETEDLIEHPTTPEVSQFPTPIPVPQPQQAPISIREEQEQEDVKNFDVPESNNTWAEPDAGTPEWTAEFYPEVYLRGHAPFTGYIKREEAEQLTERMMTELVYGYPEKYFEWRLDQREVLKPYQEAATKSLIEKDPEHALMLGLSRLLPISLSHLLPLLWEKIVGTEPQYSEGGEMWPGLIKKRMVELLGRIKQEVPEFYEKIEPMRATQELLQKERGRPISKREPSGRGSFEWLADKYPQLYLKGMDDRRNPLGHTRERPRQLEALTSETVERLLENNPIKFFEWGLNRPRDLAKFIPVAAEKIVEKDPQGALMARMFEKPDFFEFMPQLWEKLVFTAEEHGIKGYIGNLMVAFWKKMKKVHPQYFAEKIRGTPFSEKLHGISQNIAQKKWYGY